MSTLKVGDTVRVAGSPGTWTVLRPHSEGGAFVLHESYSVHNWGMGANVSADRLELAERRDESGSSSPALLACLLLALVPVSLLASFLASLAGAVAGVAA